MGPPAAHLAGAKRGSVDQRRVHLARAGTRTLPGGAAVTVAHDGEPPGENLKGSPGTHAPIHGGAGPRDLAIRPT